MAIATHHFAVVTPGRAATHLPQPGSPEAEELRTHSSALAASFIIVLISVLFFSAGTRPFLLHVLPEAIAAAGGEHGNCTTLDEDFGAREVDASWLHRVWRGVDERVAPLLLQDHAPTNRQNSMYTELQ